MAIHSADPHAGAEGPASAGAAREHDAAYQGAPGAYSEDAAFVLAGPSARLLPCESLEHVFQAVAERRARTAIVPVENTLAGTVPHAYELMLTSDLEVCAETLVRIDHVLAGPPGLALAQVRRVLSHPVALAQCSHFFRAHPEVTPVPVFDTAGAVSLALGESRGTTAAVASRRAATLNGASIIAEHIQDHDENWTRFVLLARPGAAHRGTGAAGSYKAILTFRLAHEPGALAQALAAFAREQLNLTKIESRPIHGQPFEYVFIVEVVARRPAPGFRAAMDRARSHTRSLRVLGMFPLDARDPAGDRTAGPDATPAGSVT